MYSHVFFCARSYTIAKTRKSTQTSLGKKLKFSVLVGTAIESTETSSWDETQTECMHFNPYFSRVYSTAKVEIKM